MIALYLFFGAGLFLTAVTLVLNTAAYDDRNSEPMRLRFKLGANKFAELAICFWFCEIVILTKLFLL